LSESIHFRLRCALPSRTAELSFSGKINTFDLIVFPILYFRLASLVLALAQLFYGASRHFQRCAPFLF